MINGMSVGIIIFLMGFYGIMTNKNLIKIVMANQIMANGVILFFVSIAYVPGSTWPRVGAPVVSDPVPQALMLTMIVVNLSMTAMGLALAMRLYKKHGTLDIGGMM